MTCQLGVAVFAGIVLPAALHLDGNDVGRPVIVCASSLRIEVNAMNDRTGEQHCTLNAQKLTYGQQFFVESADLPSAVHKVNLQNPVTLATTGVQCSHSIGIIGVDVEGNLIA